MLVGNEGEYQKGVGRRKKNADATIFSSSSPPPLLHSFLLQLSFWEGSDPVCVLFVDLGGILSSSCFVWFCEDPPAFDLTENGDLRNLQREGVKVQVPRLHLSIVWTLFVASLLSPAQRGPLLWRHRGHVDSGLYFFFFSFLFIPVVALWPASSFIKVSWGPFLPPCSITEFSLDSHIFSREGLPAVDRGEK